jgi:hypothetical protein
MAERNIQKLDGQTTTHKFLCAAKNVREKRRVAAGRKRGAIAIRAFEKTWDKAADNP